MFEQAKLKLHWAEKMIGELDGGCRHFASEQRCEVASQHDPETKELRLHLRGEFAPVWPSLTLLAGTCAQTISSSVDYVTSEIINTAKNVDRRTTFPMELDCERLESSKDFGTIRKFSADLAAHILNEIKPTRMDNFLLWGVRNLANTDKHRNLVLAVHNQGFELGHVKKAGMQMRGMRFTAGAGTQNEGYFSIPDVEEYGDANAIIEIALGEPDLRHPNRFYRLEVLEFLRGGLSAAAEVVNSVEQFLTPKGGKEPKAV